MTHSLTGDQGISPAAFDVLHGDPDLDRESDGLAVHAVGHGRELKQVSFTGTVYMPSGTVYSGCQSSSRLTQK